MITVCIPVYNYNITALINELSDQAESLSLQYEIIIIDDCSRDFKVMNKSACNNYTYIELSENIGRAKIRNLFLKYAKYKYLLFLDCDSIIGTSGFLSKYAEIIKEAPNVVCGGRIYNATRPGRDKMLRWKYGISRESRPCKVRQKFPGQSFMTNNFLIDRKILDEIRFDERIIRYGHEDTLFGFSLKKRNIAITHIDNPIINGDLEQNSDYLNKTKDGILNLIDILNYTNYDKELIEDITLLRFYYKAGNVVKIIKGLFVLFKPFIVFLLAKGYISLYLFDFYKLGIFIDNKEGTPFEKE
jgi:hypothetical protein